jgi:uncharacterized protein (TIGR03437 family)
VAYAYGLGAPETPVESGQATPGKGVRTARPVSVTFTGLPTSKNATVYTGLVAGQVGLYQINLRVPALPPALSACNTTRLGNVTMVVQGSASSDTVTFCAQS